VLALGRAVLAVGRPAKRVILESEQRGLIVVGLQPDVTALSPVSPVGTTFGDVGFSAKTNASRPSVTGFGVQLSAVYEGGHPYILGRGPSRGFCAVLKPLEVALVAARVRASNTWFLKVFAAATPGAQNSWLVGNF
jgi:hypothetical protein